MTPLEWFAIVTGPAGGAAYFVVRRAPYLACYGYGVLLAAQQGREVTEREAFELGRSQVFQTGATAFLGFWRRVDWHAAWAGAVHLRNDIRTARQIAWKGVKRDCRLAMDWVRRRKREKTHAEQTMANVMDAKASTLPPDHQAAILTANIAGLQAQLKKLADIPHHERTPAETNEYHAISAFLDEHYGVQQNALAQLKPQGLLAAPAFLGSLGMAPYIMAGVAFVAGIIGLDHWRIGRLKHENDGLRREAKAVIDNRALWIAAYDKERVQLAQAKASASTTAKTIETERVRARQTLARERNRQRAIQNALDGGPPPAWGLRDAGTPPAEPATLTPARADRNPG